jgi:hypothetical protein
LTAGSILKLSTFTPRPRPSFLDTLTPAGARGGERRWVDGKGKIYTYDGNHGGEIEVFSAKTGIHLGVAHILTGEVIKPPKRGRKIDV